MIDKINGRTLKEIKKGMGLCYAPVCDCSECPYFEQEDCDLHLATDVAALIQQLEEDKKRLHERICNQRRQLRVLHAMYEWALGRLQKANLNDRAHFQAFLRERGYDLATMEIPEASKEETC